MTTVAIHNLSDFFFFFFQFCLSLLDFLRIYQELLSGSPRLTNTLPGASADLNETPLAVIEGATEGIGGFKNRMSSAPGTAEGRRSQLDSVTI